ncbi:MAG: PrsW family intramembrane metalloprotease [Bryobacteraceae bacterium]|nr:PrsW family intramembrane metalloprotease [Bryobacteraceae bacterium]
MTCASCGAACNPESRFCMTCGARLLQSDAAPLTPDAPARSFAPAFPSPNMIESLAARLNQLAGTDRLEGFSLRDMFSEVFRRRKPEEIDEYFTVGTARTTPRIQDVQTGWPKPWYFMRVLAFVLLIYAGFSYGWSRFENTNLLPGLIIMGAAAMPLATVFLFWEMNTPRNVSLHRVLTMVCLGGIASLMASLFGFEAANLNWLGASQAGIVEETGKLLAVVLIVRHSRYSYILNGLLFGAAVGAGFAIFESAGYALNALFASRSFDAMQMNIQMRALLSPFGHVAWTAITAGALWRARDGGPLTPKVLVNARFWRAFLIPVALHMIWNSPLPPVMNLKYFALGVVGWFVVFGLVQQGLWQVRREQIESTRELLTESRRIATAGRAG